MNITQWIAANLPLIIQWSAANLPLIMGIAGGLHIVAVAYVNSTETPDDDKWPGKIYKVIEVIAGIVTRTAKKTPPNVPSN